MSREDVIERLLRLAGAPPPVPSERAARVRAQVHAAWRSEVAARRRPRLLLGLLAAAAAAGLAFGVTAVPPQSPLPAPEIVAHVDSALPGSSLRPGQPVMAGTALATGPAERLALRLRSGASLRLDVATRGRLLAGPEFVLDSGACYVDSEGVREALLLRTRLGLLRDVGTQFEVRLGAGLRVRVREGQVAWSGAAAPLQAGQELRSEPGRPPAYRQQAGFGAEWDWVALAAPPFEIDGRPLRPLLERIARDKGWRLRFAEPAAQRRAAGTTLHGSVAGLTPEEALQTVLPTAELGWRLDNGVLVIARSAS